MEFRLVPLVFATCLSASAGAQIGGEWSQRSQLQENLPAGAKFGYSLYGLADVDGDQIADHIVGAPEDSPGSVIGAGSVFVYSGVDGQLLHYFTGSGAYSICGVSVAATDVDGDGRADIIAGAPDSYSSPHPGTVFVWSGATGQLIYHISPPAASSYGSEIAVVSDRDGDGIDELLIGCPGFTVSGMPFAGVVDLRSGATGNLLYRWTGNEERDNFGLSVAEIDDLTGDGIPEFAFGAPTVDFVFREGTVRVVDGASGDFITEFTVTTHGPDQQFGADLAYPGDVNGDGVGDIIVGASISNYKQGRVYAMDGASMFANVIHDIPGQGPNDFYGESVSAAGDVDQDGCADFFGGAAQAKYNNLTRPGYIDLISGRTGELMQRWQGVGDFDHLGEVAMAGDLNYDGDPEYLFGAWLQDGGAGYVNIVGLDGYLRPNSNELSISGGNAVDFILDFPVSEAGQGYIMLCSLAGVGSTIAAGLEIPLIQDQLLTDMMNGWSPQVLADGRGDLDVFGDAYAILSVAPAMNALIGRRLYVAAASYERGSLIGRVSSISRSILIVP